MKRVMGLLVLLVVILSCVQPPAPLPEDKSRAQLWEEISPSVVQLQDVFGGSGTGFQVVAPSGRKFILTNRHVCDMPGALGDYLFVNRTQGVHKIIYKSQTWDLCLVQPAKNLPALKLAKEAPRIQQNVYVTGHPGGRPLELRVGYLHGMYGADLLWPPADVYSVQVMPGSSGSPVCNGQGEVVGVIAWLDPRTMNGMGVRWGQVRQFLKGW